MTYQLFNYNKALQTARLQGTVAGRYSGFSSRLGTAAGATSILNQGGYYALQDSDTNQISVKKLSNDSIYTSKWYDQVSDSVFDFSGSSSAANNSSGSTEKIEITSNMSPYDIQKLARG